MSTYELDDDLVRSFCDPLRGFGVGTALNTLQEALRSQLPARPIEEGCRVRFGGNLNPFSAAGTCGKPFDGWVLVRWDHNQTPSATLIANLVRIG